MNLDDKIGTGAPQVISRRVGEELVILDMAAGVYFGLDPVGARVWELISHKTTLSEVSEQLQAEYEVSREELERDLIALVGELRSKQLITVG